MKIVLIRHGRPTFHLSEKLHYTELAQAVEGYNNAGLTDQTQPADALREIVAQSSHLFCSPLRRSQESVERLANLTHAVTDPVFSEAGLPVLIPLPFRLSVRNWATLSRTLWLLGYHHDDIESYRTTRLRAARAAEMLISHTTENTSVCLVGHGMMNIFIARCLIRRGWLGAKKPDGNYWGYSEYHYRR